MTLVPRTKLPLWLLVMVTSGMHPAPDCTPEPCEIWALVTAIPAAPGVAP